MTWNEKFVRIGDRTGDQKNTEIRNKKQIKQIEKNRIGRYWNGDLSNANNG